VNIILCFDLLLEAAVDSSVGESHPSYLAVSQSLAFVPIPLIFWVEYHIDNNKINIDLIVSHRL
jgi:hypothetical protein